MEIMKCPHKNQKHYAKVSLLFLMLHRECAIIVIISMEGTAMQMPVLTQTDSSMLKASAKTVTSMTITSKREE
jgi:hypothetical protein